MSLKLIGGALMVVIAGTAQLQDTAKPAAARPEFEVASIKPSAIPPDGRITVMMETRDGRFRAIHEPLIDLIAFAYGVKLFQISGGPSWLRSLENGYDVDAKAGAGVSTDDSRLMLQSLLAERAELKLRSEQKELPVYELGVGKNGSKLRAAEPPGPGDRSGTFGRAGVLIGIKTSMEQLAGVLSMRLDRPVLNKTGISGFFDFNFDYAPDNQPDSAAPSVFTALKEQVGLNWNRQDAPSKSSPSNRSRNRAEIRTGHKGRTKDAVVIQPQTKIEADFVAENPGLTLFHCHQQMHMDYGFMGS